MSVNRKPTQIYATVSTSIVLVLISLFLLIFFHSGNLMNIVKQNINILVELQNGLPSGEIDYLKEEIKDYEGVISESVEFISRDQALETMSEELVLNPNIGDNPFNDLIKFNLKAEKYSESNILRIKKMIEYEKGVVGIYFENESIDMLKSNLDRISMGILLLALLFVVLALSIIYNTIQLSLHNDLKEIKTMQMVGAENSFIKKPYMQSAFYMSIKAILVMLIFIGLFFTILIYSDSIFKDIITWQYVVLTIVICIFLAFFIQFGTTTRLINKFLKLENR